MTESSTAMVATRNGSRYLQQLCKHWGHSLAVEFTAEQGKIVFPPDARGAHWKGEAVITMIAHPETLECRIDASEPEQLEGLMSVFAAHLERFAFRETPLTFNWQ